MPNDLSYGGMGLPTLPIPGLMPALTQFASVPSPSAATVPAFQPSFNAFNPTAAPASNAQQISVNVPPAPQAPALPPVNITYDNNNSSTMNYAPTNYSSFSTYVPAAATPPAPVAPAPPPPAPAPPPPPKPAPPPPAPIVGIGGFYGNATVGFNPTGGFNTPGFTPNQGFNYTPANQLPR